MQLDIKMINEVQGASKVMWLRVCDMVSGDLISVGSLPLTYYHE